MIRIRINGRHYTYPITRCVFLVTVSPLRQLELTKLMCEIMPKAIRFILYDVSTDAETVQGEETDR